MGACCGRKFLHEKEKNMQTKTGRCPLRSTRSVMRTGICGSEHSGNRGSETVAASIAFPLFLFVMLGFLYMANLISVQGVVYEGAVKVTEELAEEAYLKQSLMGEEGKIEVNLLGTAEASALFQEFVSDPEMIEKYVKDGVDGVSFAGSVLPDERGDIVLRVSFVVQAEVPLLSLFQKSCHEKIRQHAFLGKWREEGETPEGRDQYGYVTDQGTVYHRTRFCVYLKPKIRRESREIAEQEGFRICRYCRKAQAGTMVYVTEYGECYHTTKTCSRLYRNVHRIRLSETDLPPCSKCGEER